MGLLPGIYNQNRRPGKAGSDQTRAVSAAREAEKDRGAAGSASLRLVAGRRPVGRPFLPIRRAASQPDKARMRGGVLQHPQEIGGVVGGEAQLGAFGHDLSQTVERRRSD